VFGDISQLLGNGRATRAHQAAKRAAKSLKTLERRHLARSVLMHGYQGAGEPRVDKKEAKMERAQTSILTRDDTFFGVCEGLGEDLRLHPNILRLAFALGLFFNPLASVAAYAGLGLFVAALRWFVPNPTVAVAEHAAEADETAPAEAPAPATAESEDEALSIAA
jgi:phage shock protein C